MSRVSFRYSAVAVAVVALAAWSSPAAADPILSPVTTQVFVEGFAANTHLDPGTSRTTPGGVPISDVVAESYLTNTADAFAAVDGLGSLRASASVFNNVGDGITATARSSASIVNPFMIVPEAGFVGNMAMVQIPYHLIGNQGDSGSCPSCFGFLEARLSVDGMGDSVFVLGSHSEGTSGNAGYVADVLDLSGVLQGMLPVNTELYLRGLVYVGVHCQSFAGAPCDAHADFDGGLSYRADSPDLVRFVGFQPVPPDVPSVPEPGLLALVGAGLTIVANRRRSRHQAEPRSQLGR